LLKPNLLVASAADSHVTTHPTVFRAVAQHLQKAGAELLYGDSPGFGPLSLVARRAGLTQVANDIGITLADFSTGQTVSFPEGRFIKQFTIASSVLDADGIVSLPKFKTHGLVRLTGAIKNQFGCIPGLLKGQFHSRLPDVERFCQMLVDLNRLLRPRLYVMDGIVAMEGNGPRSGDPRSLGILLLSDDPVALDATACRIANLDPYLVPTNKWGDAWGLGHIEQVEILGDSLDPFIKPDFRIHRGRAHHTGRLSFWARLVRDWIVARPLVVHDNCTRCGICVQVCPVNPKAIGMRSKGGDRQPPRHDYALCIRCYCCQEMCPDKAIVIQTPLLGRWVHW
jgi:uncharacterized protein (DUF362 family)/Pyruvate/2-oxoacid:ferredoxin oxidoreductase delta subunit